MTSTLSNLIPLSGQIINLCAAILLLLGFAMLAQRRVLTLINLFMLQGLVLCVSTLVVAITTNQNHLLWSAGLTLLLKVIILPYILHRLIRRLSVKWDIETLLNIPTTMLIGIALVVIAFNVAVPQVIAFLAMENGLFFAATSATYGMPMVVELGIALDVLVGMVILGVFFFQIREQFDSLDIRHMERIREE